MSITRKLSNKKQRALEILIRLKRLYPEATCTLNYETPVQLLVATILSAQCTDERVNLVTPALFLRFPDAAALADANLEELQSLVRSTGFYRNKAKNIQAACRLLVEKYGGIVPKRMELLLELPGVARKTANVVLGHAYGINMGVTVDTHVKRLSYRLGLTEQTDPIRVERDLMPLLTQEDWENWSIRLVYHGRAVCKARKPECDRCVLADLCPSAYIIPAPDVLNEGFSLEPSNSISDISDTIKNGVFNDGN
ncbi:endonuclease III, DNA-(apurinic or apyrimidinic site) lyase [Crinalium epipsammum PCC 9333]|uniref:Endonuclease III n=1 Tax=Crinalium epipsammum PCC 9333 TaxID=1173022 RepID=K9VTE2_9CYAN|nr:endonuclease III [Crinalium epipsammum]AFZ11201.1 endonuclease III, DNA-(apurinic or apyrimidinic site) lyase [Crinalium epipsammum PCC 9333]